VTFAYATALHLIPLPAPHPSDDKAMEAKHPSGARFVALLRHTAKLNESVSRFQARGDENTKRMCEGIGQRKSHVVNCIGFALSTKRAEAGKSCAEEPEHSPILKITDEPLSGPEAGITCRHVIFPSRGSIEVVLKLV
jgi:hypothetical protein